MKKALAALIICALFLSGCGKSEKSVPPMGISISEYKMPNSVSTWATLYYPSSDNTHMLAFSQEFTKVDSLTEQIASALLSGTEQGYISPFPDSTQLRSISLVQNILYVDLSSGFLTVSPEKFFGCVSSIAYTFCDLPQVDYVNITVDGKQLTSPVTGKPIMLLSKYNGNITDLSARYLQTSDIDSFYACLYEYDASKQYLLATVKNITVSGGNYSSAIINSLLSLESERNIFPKGLSLKENPSLSNGELSVTFNFPGTWEQSTSWLGFECCAASLSYLYPSASTLNLKVEDKENRTVFSRKDKIADCYGLVRSNVSVIVADNGKLAKSSILVSRLAVHDDLKNFTVQYFETVNPDFSDASLLVNNVSLLGDTVIIDLSTEFFNYYCSKNMTSAEEYAVIFSLVSTLCTYTSSTKAMILQNNQIRSRFANSIILSYRLIALPDSYLDSLA